MERIYQPKLTNVWRQRGRNSAWQIERKGDKHQRQETNKGRHKQTKRLQRSSETKQRQTRRIASPDKANAVRKHWEPNNKLFGKEFTKSEHA